MVGAFFPTKMAPLTGFAFTDFGLRTLDYFKYIPPSCDCDHEAPEGPLIQLAVIGGVIAYSLLRQDDEPTYQGHRLGFHWPEDQPNTSCHDVLIRSHLLRTAAS